MSEQPFAQGGCLCGAVRYTVTGEPKRMAQCHCKDCQRASGTGHMSLAMFAEEDVSVEGELGEYAVTADSGNINTREFCPKCGSRVFSRNSGRPGIRNVAVGTADDTSWFEPQAIVYASGRASWDVTGEGIPNFDKMPPPPPK